MSSGSVAVLLLLGTLNVAASSIRQRSHIRVPGSQHGSNFPAAAYEAAAAALSQMNLTQKVNMVHGWGAPLNPGYAGFVPGQGATVSLSLADGAQGVGNGFTEVTAYPSAMTMTAAWDVDLACAYGGAIGAEQFAKGTNVALAPGLNLARVPWSGRVYEYLGEDPFLAASISFAYVTCMQRNNITATVKHFMGNNQELNRGGMSSNIPARAARELYYASFQGAVDAGVGAVMLGTNAVNDTKNYNNSEVIGYLKGDMGFEGWAMTDWDGPTSWDNANAGLDQGMPGTGGPGACPFWDPLLAAVEAGNVSAARIDDMVTRMLVPMFALGIQANPPSPDRNPGSNASTTAHATLAREVSEQSMVLLKNDAVGAPALPLLPLNASALPRGILIVGDRDTVVEPNPNSGIVQTPYIVSPFSGVLRYLAAHFDQAGRPAACSRYPDIDFFQNGVPCNTMASEVRAFICACKVRQPARAPVH
jgi:beta-glucosidase